jgi:type VI secretion system secreted protein VgrG
MSLFADQDVSVSSVNGSVYIRAQKELTLESDGAFIQLKDGSITLGDPLDLFIKTITIQKAGKASMTIPIPASPLSLAADEEVIRQSYSLLKDGTTPVDGYYYDLYPDKNLHTQKGEYSDGETATVSGQSALQLVTWIARDSARKEI